MLHEAGLATVVPSLDAPLRLVVDRGASRHAARVVTWLLEMVVVGTVRQLVAVLSAAHTEATARRLLVDIGARLSVLPCEAGVGLSQLVSLVVAALGGSRRRLVLLEQPELLLHPGIQVGLGDLFIEASRDRQLIVETHSEHILLRVLRRIREIAQEEAQDEVQDDAPSFTPASLSVLYIEAGDDGMQIRKLRVDAKGELLDPWPGGFFDERVQELF